MPGMASVPSTMAPFLYQTRTIQRQSVALARSSAHLLSRTISTSQPLRHDNDVEAAFLSKFDSLPERSASKEGPKIKTRKETASRKKFVEHETKRRKMLNKEEYRAAPMHMLYRGKNKLDDLPPEHMPEQPENAPQPPPPPHTNERGREREGLKTRRRRHAPFPASFPALLQAPAPEPMPKRPFRNVNINVENPWWQVAGLEDTAIEQPPVLGLRRGADENQPPRFAVWGPEGEVNSGVPVESEPWAEAEAGTEAGAGAEPEAGAGAVAAEAQARTEAETVAYAEAGSEASAEAYAETHAESESPAKKGAGSKEDDGALEKVLDEEDGFGANADSDAAWANKASGPMQLPSVPELKTPEPEKTPWDTFADSARGAQRRSTSDSRRQSERRTRREPSVEDIPWGTVSQTPFSPDAEVEDDALEQEDSNEQDVPFEFGSNPKIEGDEESDVITIGNDRPHISTLTRPERLAFGKIWSEIVLFNHRPKVPPHLISAPEISEPEARSRQIRTKEEDVKAAQSAVKYLIKDAAYSAMQGESRSGPNTVADQMRNARYRSAVLKYYPTSVREVAFKALGLQIMPHSRAGESQLGLGLQEDPDTVLRRIKAMGIVDSHVEKERQKEWTRMRDLLLDTPTDRHLWDVLEEHVFSIPARLGIDEQVRKQKMKALPGSEDDAEQASIDNINEDEDDLNNSTNTNTNTNNNNNNNDNKKTKTDKAKAKTKTKTSDNDMTPSEEATAPEPPAPEPAPPQLPIDVYGPVYPALLIAAHRQLVRNFTPSSPLVFQLLPRVKSLGLASYVLGASTTLYNETISLWWTHRGDLRAVLSMLEEMNAAGLYPDSHTEKLLDRINLTLRVCEGGAGGWSGFVPSMMRMGGFSAGLRRRMEEAHARVKEAVVTRGQILLR